MDLVLQNVQLVMMGSIPVVQMFVSSMPELGLGLFRLGIRLWVLGGRGVVLSFRVLLLGIVQVLLGIGRMIGLMFDYL